MNTIRLVVSFLFALGATVAAQSPDAATRLARSMAETPADTAAGTYAGTPTPRVLFHEVGDDNAQSLLVAPDCDGDGVMEVVTGWDIFKTGDNLTVSSGAGFLPGHLVWSLESTDGISGGYFYSQEAFDTYPDVNSDGVDEILGGTAGGGRAATLYDGATGAVIQSFNTYLGADNGWVYDVEVVGDVNANGTIDFAIAVGSDDDAVYMVDGGSTGTHHDEIWRHQGPDVFYNVISVGDMNKDGVPDVVAGNGDNSSSVRCLSGKTGEALWTVNSGATNWHMNEYPDIDGDGVGEVLIGSWQTQGARMLNGKNGAVRWTQNTASTQVMRVVATTDANGDTVPDVVAAASAGGAWMLSGTNGDVIWSINPSPLVWAIDPVPDVTGDGVDEVAYGDFNGITWLVDGTDGTTLWTHDTNGHKVMALRGAPDMDGDGHGEVVVGAQQLSSAVEPMVFVLDADSGLASDAPELTPSGAVTLGTTLPLSLTGATPGHTAFTLVGLDPALVPFFGKGTLAIDTGFYLVLLTQVVPGGGDIATPLAVPNNPAWDGLSFYMQTFVLTGSPATGASSNRIGVLLQS
ncbi:MAG: hypothetical protein ACYTCU_09125 [Planctomycetota bacterium]|jgi:hypothetical protein